MLHKFILSKTALCQRLQRIGKNCHSRINFFICNIQGGQQAHLILGGDDQKPARHGGGNDIQKQFEELNAKFETMLKESKG